MMLVVAAVLIAAGVLVAARLAIGPSTLDRAVALDALVSVIMAGIGVYTAVQHVPFYLPVMLVLAFLGFTGSVAIARFMTLRDEAGTTDVDESRYAGKSADTLAEQNVGSWSTRPRSRKGSEGSDGTNGGGRGKNR
ncbi:monovalent cation/H+ antiporter complex subunit F [Streptomyces xiaopingdaonensis]|uniref:monovalent cation/H+ antiporter complex subunit F n=1 Tax=Streptomyces xiaopingdaonensis TaxID=1565415 RepID=UPI000D0AAD68|nr:monovalent cation/H+ antiporter complex subunit F [Streptomyces xiaopingdaonensis]